MSSYIHWRVIGPAGPDRTGQLSGTADRVLSAGAKPDVYAEQLLTVTARLPASFIASSVALAMGRAARIGRRLESILDGTRDRQAAGRAFKAGVFLTGLAVCAAVAGYEAITPPATAANIPDAASSADAAAAEVAAPQAASR